jgi:site-specific DNA recombinase
VIPTLRCAAYARYSTDRQNPLSTEDQLAKCRQYAQERGWPFLEDEVYTDEEVSGATIDRPGLNSLLSAIDLRPRPFDVLLLEDASRLSRKQAELLNLCERLTFAGVKVHFISQGIDSSDEKFQLLLLARGMIDQLFLSDTAKRVRRGLEGLIRRGLHTGGRCYGYRSRKDDDGTRLEIHEPEAEVVKRIFQMYAGALSLKAIARKLNGEGVASPQPQQGRISRSWCPSSIRTILHNERYTGKVIWSRKHKVHDPRTGRRVSREREGDEPVRGADAPQLRIVSEELWSAVRERQELVKRLYEDAGKRAGLLRSSAMNSPYLLSGLLKCRSCGANLQIVAGRGRNHKTQTYGCPMNYQRGDSVCSNRVRVHRDVLERELLAGLQEKVLRTEVVDYILEQFEGKLIKELENIGGEMDRMKAQKSELEAKIRRLVAGLATGIESPAVMGEIANCERQVAAISDRLLSSTSDSIRTRIKWLREQAMARIQELRDYLNRDTPKARAFLERHVGKIVMEPSGKSYVASGNWSLLGEIRWDGAEGSGYSVSLMPEIAVPFEGVFRKAA